MASIPDTHLPTLDRLGITVPLPAISSSDAKSIAQEWLSKLSSASSHKSVDVDKILSILHPTDPWWRDMLAFTWDLRTFSGSAKIRAFLSARLAGAELHDLTLDETYTEFQQPFPDLAWIVVMFKFKNKVGAGTGITRLVPFIKPNTTSGDQLKLEDIEWKAHIVYTNLETLTDFPEKVGSLRNAQPNHGKWAAEREAETSFVGAEEDPEKKGPKVLIIGAGQSGLGIAARLKALDISSLVVEKNERVGDNWRQRYEALCLHDPVWYDHMPYLPFPTTWPVYTPALKLANWLESYAESLELNVWTSSTITSLTQDSTTQKWHATVIRRRISKGNLVEEERKFVVNHIVFCTGLGNAVPVIPSYPGISDKFKGEVLHSLQHKRALDHEGKKVVVVGACTSAHDISVDYYDHGVDVTMFQRSSTYVMSTKRGWEVLFTQSYSETSPPSHISDLFTASIPHHLSVGILQRASAAIAELDKDLLDGLHKVGFKTNMGIKGSGFPILAWSKAGGYYLDTGASQLIADGKIKLKSDGSSISHFTERAVVFDNGTELEADVVIFATGLGDAKDRVLNLCGPTVYNKLKPLWGLDDEGELNSVWKDSGVPGLWYMMGNLSLCRFYSKHVVLQIKAMEEGLFGTRYEG